jgi:hypothetical protein
MDFEEHINGDRFAGSDGLDAVDQRVNIAEHLGGGDV